MHVCETLWKTCNRFSFVNFFLIFQTLLSPFRRPLSPEPLAGIKEDHRKHVQSAYYTLFRLSDKEYLHLFYKIYIHLIQNRLTKEDDTNSDKVVCVFALGEVRQGCCYIHKYNFLNYVTYSRLIRVDSMDLEMFHSKLCFVRSVIACAASGYYTFTSRL